MSFDKEEYKFLLDDLVQSDGFKVFLVDLESLLEHYERDVINYTLVGGEESELIYRKLIAEGARKFLYDIKLKYTHPKKKSVLNRVVT